MTISLAVAKDRAFECLCQRLRDSIALVPVADLPTRPYGFEPHGWMLFRVQANEPRGVGPSEYVAVNRSSGEVRHLGLLGE